MNEKAVGLSNGNKAAMSPVADCTLRPRCLQCFYAFQQPLHIRSRRSALTLAEVIRGHAGQSCAALMISQRRHKLPEYGICKVAKVQLNTFVIFIRITVSVNKPHLLIFQVPLLRLPTLATLTCLVMYPLPHLHMQRLLMSSQLVWLHEGRARLQPGWSETFHCHAHSQTGKHKIQPRSQFIFICMKFSALLMPWDY